jgi:hypothetical protein
MPAARSLARRERSASRGGARVRTPTSAKAAGAKSTGKRRSAAPSPAPAPAASAQKAAPFAKKAGPAAAAAAASNPVTTHFEFMGPYIGPVGILVGLPILVWASAFFCNKSGWPAGLRLPTGADIRASFSLEVFAVYVAWWLFQAALAVVVPGKDVEGVTLRDGSRLKYRINGERASVQGTRAA